VLQPLFFILLFLALVGDARVFFFVANRIVFGSHKEEKPPFHWMLYAVPPLLLVLTLLFWPLHRWIGIVARNELVERLTPEPVERVLWSLTQAKIGAAWLFIAAGIGTYWIIDRLRVLAQGERVVAGTRTHESEVIRLRKAHVPIALLRRLGAHNDIYDIETTKHEVFIQGLPESFDGYRIAFLTDTHVAGFVRRDFYKTIVARTLQFEPDLLLFGGDFVHWERHIPLMADVLFSELRAKDGIYAVLGNHDYWANGDGVIAALTSRGVKIIHNRSIYLQRGTGRIGLVGIDEIYRGRPDIDAAFALLDPRTPRIGLSHHPDVVDLLEGRHLDLLLCGHTHGGQIRFPFFGSVVVPSRHEGRYASGFHRVGDVLLYVSRGIGAIPPLRILCKPEIATFILRPNLHETDEALRGLAAP
jgi:predicted MPP superfamily phosphohydrolase